MRIKRRVARAPMTAAIRRPPPMLPAALAALLVIVLPGGGMSAAELEPRTAQAFAAYSAEVIRGFRARALEGTSLWGRSDPKRRQQLDAGRIVAGPAEHDGIMEVPGGLIHHWIAAVFVRGVPLSEVLSRERNYQDYPRVHKPILQAELIGRDGTTDRVRLRIEQRTRFVHAVLDTWWRRDHYNPGPGRAFVVATAERIQQVEKAGTPAERRLPVGEGGGYLWRANTFMKFVEEEGGTYIEFQTLGLSRGFPPLLGWIAEPIVRGIGRGSVERTLDELRADLTGAPLAHGD